MDFSIEVLLNRQRRAAGLQWFYSSIVLSNVIIVLQHQASRNPSVTSDMSDEFWKCLTRSSWIVRQNVQQSNHIMTDEGQKVFTYPASPCSNPALSIYQMWSTALQGYPQTFRQKVSVCQDAGGFYMQAFPGLARHLSLSLTFRLGQAFSPSPIQGKGLFYPITGQKGAGSYISRRTICTLIGVRRLCRTWVLYCCACEQLSCRTPRCYTSLKFIVHRSAQQSCMAHVRLK